MRSTESIVAPPDALGAIARARFRRSSDVPAAFFAAHAAGIARACRDLARSFHGGGQLFALGGTAEWSDALHVAVEFVHPVIVGKRALPAHAVPAHAAGTLAALGRPGDAVLGITAAGDAAVSATLAAARAGGLCTIALTGPARAAWPVDHRFAVDTTDALVVQEVHETCYHVFWELVHVFLDHPGSLQ